MSFFERNSVTDPAGWVNSFRTGLCQDQQGDYIPWMPYSLIEYLKENLSQQDVIFEYGFGTSTVFFASHVKKVFSIESNQKWHQAMMEIIAELKIENLNTIAMFDALENPDYELAALEIAQNLPNFKGFDWVVIDSLKRAKCAKNAIAAIKPDGKILLDDSQRSNYQKIYDDMIAQGFKCQEFSGVAPGQIKQKKAWIFSRQS